MWNLHSPQNMDSTACKYTPRNDNLTRIYWGSEPNRSFEARFYLIFLGVKIFDTTREHNTNPTRSWSVRVGYFLQVTQKQHHEQDGVGLDTIT